jgi:hypothetical protein
VIEPANCARRDELIGKGATVAQRYTLEKLLPQWHSFITSARMSQV